MKCRALAPAAALLIVLAGNGYLLAADEPHGMLWSTECLTCHAAHKAAGQNLTDQISNESLCASCHNLAGTAAAFPTERMFKADPSNRLGASHAWNTAGVNAAAGASLPSDPGMALRAPGGNIVCSTCHNQHRNDTGAVTAQRAGTQNRSTPVRISGTGSGTLTYSATADATAKGYLLEIVEVEGPAGTAKFRLSNDAGVSWFGYSGGSWVPYTAGNAALTGSSVVLNDSNRVTVTFSGNFVLGDRHRFYVGYPFLRVQLDAGTNAAGSKFCRDCHTAWTMDHSAINVYTGSPKSHPVGVTLNANGGGYDRLTPLDGNGTVQGGAGNDTNPSNDLLLAGDATVQCFTCHLIHHGDGNTLTNDRP